MLDLPLPP
uniref:Uncharacterized protein n=1 Tax=Arundo donax TaxID=35708 RepID=A0A0A8ZXR2_ARUDO